MDKDANPSLKNSELHKFYSEFNEDCNTNVDDLYCTIQISPEAIGPSAKKLCNVFFCNLKQLLGRDKDYFTKKDESYKINNRCMYLKFWLYDQVIKGKLTENDVKNIINDWEREKDISLSEYNCPCEFYEMKQNEIKEIKQLYDYFVFYDAYKKFSIINNKIYNSSYCKYLKSVIDLYNKKVVECKTNENSVCMEFNNYIKSSINADYLLAFNGECKNEKLSKSRYRSSETLVTVDSSLFSLLEEDEILNDKKLIKFYNLLNKEYDYFDNSLFCDIVRINNTPIKRDVYKNCNKLKSILDNWELILEYLGKETNKDKYCEYLNYWLHAKITGNSYSKRIVTLLYTTWNWIKESKPGNSNSICYHKSFIVSEEDFKNMKDLYEFMEYYDDIKKKLEDDGVTKKNKYCDYIKSRFSLYHAMEYEMDMCGKFSMYIKELSSFKDKMEKELTNIERNCPGVKLNSVFKKEPRRTISTVSETFEESVKEELTEVKIYQKNIFKCEFKLEKLPSIIKYKELNNFNDLNKYCDDCKDILMLEMDYPGISALCAKIARNLRKLSTMSKKESINNCEYITHWIYDDLKTSFGNGKNYIYDIPFAYKLLDAGLRVNNRLKSNNCNYSYNYNMSFDELKEKKDLHDYFKDYETILNNMPTLKENVKNELCKKITPIVKLYEKHIWSCCEYFNDDNHYNENCGNYFKCKKEYNPYKLLDELDCGDKESYKNLENIYDKLNIDNIIKLFEEKAKKKPKIIEKVKVVQPITIEHTEDTFEFDLFNISTLGIFSLLGILLICFILYKFTPIGSYLHRRSLRKKQIKQILQEQHGMRPPVNIANPMDMGRQNRRVKIAYQPQ
ncbi:VIR protein [Plasmodium vivax]|uniref:VIR protein n=1 Tax=Plasmodium vivax TaxID=5855 RepID=A0A1G4E8R7_PLAVI|nr:VIR protein [Plasmodium vivax]